MNCVDLLSDTVYRDQAAGRLDQLLKTCKRFPVQRSQLYGLRQVARQEPGEVANYADRQRRRAQAKQKEGKGSNLMAEIDFWELVSSLCEDPRAEWSVAAEGRSRLPAELRQENVPSKHEGMSPAERRRRNELKRQRKAWLNRWNEAHIPAFFERFFAHALYRQGLSESSHRREDRT